jgi:hypothetical protein
MKERKVMKNQMWKKGVCLGMAAMMTAGMLAGCGESSESKDTAMVQTGEDGVVESGRYTLDADTPASIQTPADNLPMPALTLLFYL